MAARARTSTSRSARATKTAKTAKTAKANRKVTKASSAKTPKAGKSSKAAGQNAAAAPDADQKRRAQRIFRALHKQYPEAKTALHHRNAFELLVATILSAQCTDERVNMVTPELFQRYPDAPALAAAKPADVEQLIKTTGFYRNKTKSIQGAARAIVDKHDGKVPDTMDELLTLPGVARKTANCVLGNAYGKNIGVVVDTHVMRLSQRLGFTEHSDPVKIERDLMALFPRRQWTMLSHLLIFHGRSICKARTPMCSQCPVNKDCPKIGVDPDKAG